MALWVVLLEIDLERVSHSQAKNGKMFSESSELLFYGSTDRYGLLGKFLCHQRII